MVLDDVICAIKAAFVWMVDGIGWIIDFLIGWLIALLPNTPFVFEPIQWGPFGQLIGYVFPVTAMFQHMIFLLTAIAVYYLIRHLLRLVRMVK